MKYPFDRNDLLAAGKIIIIYAIFGVLWIYLSDTALGFFVQDREIMLRLSVYKGLFFIFVTSLLLYLLVIRQIHKMKRAEKELRGKKEEMERFTYMVSHDLKSPLITIKTFLGYLEQDLKHGNMERASEDMSFISDAADKMGGLLEELLEMSRIGRITNPPVRATFRELVDEALRSVAGPISMRGVKIIIADDDISLFGDRARLEAIWQNLVENAVKYMGGQMRPVVEIGFDGSGAETIFFVRDNGMGIDPADRDRIFGFCSKLDPASDGPGLGLAMTKKIIEHYGGKISVESEGLGHGACFRFTLPEAVKNPESLR